MGSAARVERDTGAVADPTPNWGRPRVRGGRRVALVCLAYLVAWGTLDAVSGYFHAAPEISTWYPPAGLDLALLLVLGLRWGPLLLLTTPLNFMISSGGVPLSWGTIALYDVISSGAYWLAAWVLLRGVRIDPRLREHRDVLWLVLVGCLAAPALAAVGQVTLLSRAGAIPWDGFVDHVAGYWAGDATGVGMLTAFLLVVRARGPWPRRSELLRSRWELLGQVGLLAACLWTAFGVPADGTMDYAYAVYLPLGWIAVRAGFPGTTVAVLVANVGAVMLHAAYGGGEGGLKLQFGLVTLTLTSLLLASLVSQNRRDARATEHAALHDPLTGLGNRTLLADRAEHAAARARRQTTGFWALLAIDLDGFKAVNDALGHAAGDHVLAEVGRRLRASVRPADTVARVGGDEFTVLLEDLGGRCELDEVGQRTLEALERPYTVERRTISVTGSVGSARGRWRDGPTEVMRDADLALREAKRRGRNRYQPFTADLGARRAATLQLEAELREALETGGLRTHLQPICRLTVADGEERTPGDAVGFEALARWPLAGGGSVSPDAFIPLAEETDLIARLGLEILDQALETLVVLRGRGGEPSAFVSVNLSPRQLERAELCDEVLGALRAAGLPPSALHLEITESIQLTAARGPRSVLQRLADSGVRLALDDFGTGFSSLAYVPELPVHSLKLDRRFVSGLPGDRYAAAVVQAVLALAASLELEVVAEGIETPAQLEHLRAAGCELGQGYLLGAPAPSEAYVEDLAGARR